MRRPYLTDAFCTFCDDRVMKMVLIIPWKHRSVNICRVCAMKILLAFHPCSDVDRRHITKPSNLEELLTRWDEWEQLKG